MACYFGLILVLAVLPAVNMEVTTAHDLTGIYNSVTHIRRGDIICLRISCEKESYVKSCEKNGTSDTCLRCSSGTILPDPTSSQLHNYECRKIPDCLPDARRSLIPYFCAGHHKTYCVCDRSRNFCGVDPCACTEQTCPFGTVLQTNCGCDRNTTYLPIPDIPKDDGQDLPESRNENEKDSNTTYLPIPDIPKDDGQDLPESRNENEKDRNTTYLPIPDIPKDDGQDLPESRNENEKDRNTTYLPIPDIPKDDGQDLPESRNENEKDRSPPSLGLTFFIFVMIMLALLFILFGIYGLVKINNIR